MTGTDKRKISFAKKIMGTVSSPIAFIDVGAGGKLKRPWSLLPENKLRKYDFEPTDQNLNGLPVCVSNQTAVSDFHVSYDERSSSVHQPSVSFTKRFGQPRMLTEKKIQVQLTTLDSYFSNVSDRFDLIDINVEGHDFQVLEGAARLLTTPFKLVKVEFELAQVWHGQGWLSNIDELMRKHNYELADIDIAYLRPAHVKQVFHRGEPVWGKAFYVPSLDQIADDMKDWEQAAKLLVLYTLTDMPGRAIDILNAFHGDKSPFPAEALSQDIMRVFQFTYLEGIIGKVFDKFSSPLKQALRKLSI